MRDSDTLDPAGQVGLPVDAANVVAADGLDRRAFIRLHGKFRVSVLNVRPQRCDTFGKQIIPVAFNAKAGAEG